MALLYDTNYFQKSLDDLTAQLQDWEGVARDSFALLDKELDPKTKLYLDEKWPDLGILLGNAHELLKTIRAELSVITKEAPQGIRKDHIKRLLTLGNELSSINKDLGKIWNTGSLYRTEDGENFWKLHTVYSKTRDNITALSELATLTKRLEDFVKKEAVPTNNIESSLNPTEANYPKSIHLITEKLEPTSVIFLVLDEQYEAPTRCKVNNDKGRPTYIRRLYDIAYLVNAPNKQVDYRKSLSDAINNAPFRRREVAKYMRTNKLVKPTLVQKAEYADILVLKGDIPVKTELIKNIPTQYQSLYTDKIN